MLVWVVDVLQFIIDTLRDWQSQGAVGDFKALAWALGTAVVPVVIFFLAVRSLARRRYLIGLEELSEARHEIKAKDEALATLRTEKARRDQKIAALELKAPDGFARVMDAHLRDANTELELRDAHAYLDFHRAALRRAHGVVIDDLIGHAAGEGVSTFAIALSHAQAALALTPDDEALRDIAAELAEAATIAPSARVRLATPEERAERMTRRAELPNDLEALQMAWNEAFDHGRYRLSLTFARHGLRAARRGFGPGSETHVFWATREGLDLSRLGQSDGALPRLRQLLSTASAVLGTMHGSVLNLQYLIAHCQQNTGDAAGALQAARGLLPVVDCVKGAEHPHTIRLRTLIAKALLDQGAATEARAAHDGVSAALRARGLRSEHRFVRDAMALDARLAEDG